jgi:hypothetical protein
MRPSVPPRIYPYSDSQWRALIAQHGLARPHDGRVVKWCHRCRRWARWHIRWWR